MQRHSLNTRVHVHPATPKHPGNSKSTGTANRCCPFFGRRVAIAPEKTQAHAGKVEEIRGAFPAHSNSPLRHRELDRQAIAGNASVPVKKEMWKVAINHDCEQTEPMKARKPALNHSNDEIERLLSSLARNEVKSPTSNSVSDFSEASDGPNQHGDSFFITSGTESIAVSSPAKQGAPDRLRKMIEEDSCEIFNETRKNTYLNGYVIEPALRKKNDYVNSEGGTLRRPAAVASYYAKALMELVERDMEAEDELNSAVMEHHEYVATYRLYGDKLELGKKVNWLKNISLQKKSISSMEKAKAELEYQIKNLLQSEEYKNAKEDLARLNEEWLPKRGNEVSVKANRVVQFALPDASVGDGRNA